MQKKTHSGNNNNNNNADTTVDSVTEKSVAVGQQHQQHQHKKETTSLSWMDRVLPDYMNEGQRENLLRVKQGGAKYHFQVVNLSIAEGYFLEPFWAWVTVTFYPTWLAPNLITFIGFILMVISQIMLWTCYPLVVDSVLHQWWYRICCVIASSCLFLYQTLDGSDGKQARRIGQSSPLGEVFDHGVDAICLTFHVTILAMLTVHTPDYSKFAWVAVVGMWFAFFTAHFEHLHTKCFYVGLVGVPDAQLLVVVACLVTTYCGYTFWTGAAIDMLAQFVTDYLPTSMIHSILPLVESVSEAAPLVIRNITLGDMLMWSVVAGGIVGGFRCVFVVAHRVSIAALVDLLPLTILSVSFTAYTILAEPIWISQYFSVCTMFGLVFGIILTSYNVARVSESPFFVMNKQCNIALVPLVVLVLNSLPAFYGSIIGLDAPPVDETLMLYGVFIFETIHYVIFASSVIRSFCRALAINAFTVTVPKMESKKNL